MARPVEADFDVVGRRWIDDAVVNPASVVPRIVYHYTDAAGLIGMLQSRRIWLTDYRFLNDTAEFVHIQKLVRTLLARRAAQAGPTWRTAFHDHILHWQRKPTPEDAFVFSCSTEQDDLSQWRGYASEGCGFTIGFASASLAAMPAQEGHTAFSRVIYRDDQQESALANALDEMEEIILNAGELSPEELEATLKTAACTFDWIATNRGALNKHGSFANEREWRLVHYISRQSDAVKVRARGKSLVPYVEVGAAQPLDIRAVGIGPGHTNPHIIEAVRNLTRGYRNLEIYQADTPYRQT
ncbi:DUF2971 domain-containing protein [Sphingomonas sp. VNH70]|uniref:DUF2971 domain-containing protein n=1 Tax=Sphingomonas silueang TaxID=3156617 RepID=UPI0032B43630